MNVIEEAKRLDELYSYQILDTLPETSFDKLVEVASLVANCPISLISLIDKDRQWFKSKVGVSVNQTNRDIAMCSHAIQTPFNPLIVNNTEDHPVFKDNPLVTQNPKVRFYAGFPLVTPNGFAIGTLCVIDTKTKSLTVDQIKILTSLADQAMIIFEYKKAQKRFYAAQELRAIKSKFSFLGKLTGGIAHEINNPLAIILGKISLLKKYEQNNQLYQDNVSAIETVSWRISKIVKSLYEFSHDPDHFIPNSTTLKDVIEQTLLLCEGKIKSKSINLEVNIPKDSIDLYIDKQKIKDALLNLLFNSIDAIKNLSEKWIKINVEDSSEYILFSIIDSGNGIPKEFQDHLFIPFFSTKEIGKGMGLGLSDCMGIARAHMGDAYLDSSSVNTKMVLKIKKKVTSPKKVDRVA